MDHDSKTSGMTANGAGIPRPGMLHVGSIWPLVAFMLLGFLGSGFIAVVGRLVQRHTHRHRDLIFVSLVLIGLPLAVYLGAGLRQAVKVGVGLLQKLSWWHMLWFLIYMSALTLRRRDPNEIKATPVDSAAAFRIVLVTFTGCVLLLRLFLRRTQWLKSWFQGVVGALTIFALVGLVSTLWSVYWQWTLYKSCEYAVETALLAAILVSVDSPESFKTLFSWTWLFYGAQIFAYWVEAFLWPELALQHNVEYGAEGVGVLGVQLYGVFPDLSSNKVGEYGALIAAIALCRLLPAPGNRRRNWIWYTWVFGLGMITLIFAQTRSAILGLGLAVFVLFLFSNRVKLGAAIVCGGGFLVLVTGLGSVIFDYLKRGQTTSELTSLSSRLNWWAFAWQRFTDAPLTGLGAWAASRFAIMTKMGTGLTASLHSDWVDILAGTGFWGVIPVAIAVGLAWWTLIRFFLGFSSRPFDRQLAIEAIAALSVTTVRMFFSTDLTGNGPLPFFLPLVFAEFLRRRAKNNALTPVV